MGGWESVGGIAQRRASFGPCEIQEEQIHLFAGPFKVRPDWRLHAGRSGGTLSGGPELILEIPA
jgi:hypothetical protein